MKLWKRLGAVVLTVALVAGFSISSASACTSLYVGSDLTENGSTYFGRGEDIGEHYDKVFQVMEAADHEEGEMYEDAYGFSMPWPAHTYRYTYVRDSLEYGENITDDDGNVIIPAYAQAGINELGVSVTATVSTIYDNDFLDEFDPPTDEGICELSIAGVILQEATSARHGVEILANILDEYGAGDDYGYYNSILIGDTEEVWNFQIVSAHNYVAVKLPADKVSINPNIVVMGNVDVSDTENVVASKNLISLAEENGFLVSPEENVINIRETYGTDDGKGQYTRYYQGVYYLNGTELDIETMDEDGKLASADVGGPISYLFDTDRELSTLDVLRFFATRGEGTEYDSNEDSGIWAVGNEHQAEVHVFEVRHDAELPAELATVEWLAMNRSEYSIFLPFYSALVTETSDIYHCEWTNDDGEDWAYYNPDEDMELFGDLVDSPADLPDNSFFWVITAINDLCDNDRERYGVNVKAFWEAYQKALIEQQAAVDKAMLNIYNANPESAEEAATALGKAVAEEAFGYAKQILSELWDFIQADEAGELDEDAVFTPSVMGKLPTYGSSFIFVDVASGVWYEAAVEYAVENNLILGVPGSKFAPTTPATRGQFMTILARYAGVDTNGSSPWYKAGQEWAVQNGVSDGTSVDKNIKRQDLVTMLWRLEGKPEVDQDLSAFSDASEINDYALQAMQWAVQSGVLNGDGHGHLSPSAATNRCELAQIMMNYIENIKG